MFILEMRAADEKRLSQRSARCGRGTETFLGDEGEGGIVLCHAKACRAGKGTLVRRTETRLARGDFGRKGGRHLLFVGAWVPSDFRSEFVAWYEMDHLPILLQCPSWDGCRIVEEKVADGVQFYALHQVSDPAAFESDERRRSRDTPWFLRLKAHDWFDEAFSRRTLKRIGR